MKLLKKIWDKLGDEKFSSRVMVVGCTLITIYNLLFMNNLPEFNALMIILNGAMIFAAVMED